MELESDPAIGTMDRVRIVASLLLIAVVLACFGCASARRSGNAADWQDTESVMPLSMLATQGVSSRAIEGRLTSSASGGSPRPNAATNTVEPAHSQPTPTVTPPAPTSLVSLREWCRGAGLHEPLSLDSAHTGFSITNASGQKLRLAIGSQIAGWQGMEVHLGYSPALIRNQAYVQSADIKSTFAPLLCGIALPPVSGPVIVLDPGHGGTDSGTMSPAGAKEKEFTLDWARRLQALLAADGWQVYLTRTSDVDVALSNRVAVADSVGAHLFLSLHFNSAPPDKRGIETYCLTPAGVPSTLTRGYIDELDLSLPNNNFDSQNLRLAVMVHRALLGVDGWRDRGVRRARFPTVLRGQRRPAVLVEGGYLSNPAEARLISDGRHRQKMAEAIASALRPLAPAALRTSTNSQEAAAAPHLSQ